MEKSLIVAVADNYAIGRKNALLWNLPGDMKYFRQQTTGNAVIMGWMTFQSIGRPLPKRHNIVISLFPWPDAPEGVTVVDSLDAAFAAAEMADQVGHDEKAFVIGGAYTYAEAMGHRSGDLAGGQPQRTAGGPRHRHHLRIRGVPPPVNRTRTNLTHERT